MSKLIDARKSWVGKSDEWLYERLSNELTDKVSEIHKLIGELEIVKNIGVLADVSESTDTTRFLKMVMNSYKVINNVDDYRKIHYSIVEQANTLYNKLIDNSR